MVTHDAFAASYTNRVLFIKDGAVFNELRRGDESRDAFFARIMEVGPASCPAPGRCRTRACGAG